jgi:hypothetical protein
MKYALICFWSLMIFASIAWYGILLFYVGIKGGYEILQMARTLSQRPRDEGRPDQR